jgi:hypothetical protein
MDEIVLAKIKRHEGGLGVIQLRNNERVYARDIKIDVDKKTVTGLQEKMQFTGDKKDTDVGPEYFFVNTRTPFEVQFDDIIGFDGRTQK